MADIILIVGSTIIAVISGLIIVFFNKATMQKRRKELAIIYALGYSKKQVQLFIIQENLIFYGINTLIAYVFLWVLNRYVFQFSYKYEYLNTIFSSKNIGMTIIFIGVISLISMLWGLAGVKQKKLVDSLT